MRVMSAKHVLRLMVASALAGAAIAIIHPGPAVAAGVPCQRTLSNPNDYPIPDNSPGVVIDIDAPEDGLVVSDVDVSVDIDHTWISDLTLRLYSFTDVGAYRGDARLFTKEYPGGENLHGTVFDDEASTPVSWSFAPFTGRFKPSKPLAALDNASGGLYRLLVADDEVGDVGTVRDWSVTLTYKSCDFDSDGVEDHADSCLGVTAHTATGCPLTTRAVTAKYKHGAFKGLLSSPVAGCKSGQSVTIWKVRSGADKVVGSTTTRSDGSYKLKRGKHAGKYYATSPRVAVTDVAECPAVQSATFRIR